MMPVLSFGHNTQVNTRVKVIVVNEKDLVISEKSTKVFTDLPDALSMYTDILIVDAASYYSEEFRAAYVNESVNANMFTRTIPESFTME